ncbi:hypothetical protein EVAR_75734_1 [Eumeta japonica]|uniref:Uncharacterized protein n=1 Tax=Eumeta variegata TaxID=151549 RepID=A0A4C1TFC4_EUMVA|nr:hypothetical protein EVAR_75734_1 [Eumeta japonica]
MIPITGSELVYTNYMDLNKIVTMFTPCARRVGGVTPPQCLNTARVLLKPTHRHSPVSLCSAVTNEDLRRHD